MWVCVQDIADEQAGGEGEALQRQQSAVQRATKVLLNRHAAPTGLVLTYLPWLISASPKHALLVLKVPSTQIYSRRSTPDVFTSVCLYLMILHLDSAGQGWQYCAAVWHAVVSSLPEAPAHPFVLLPGAVFSAA